MNKVLSAFFFYLTHFWLLFTEELLPYSSNSFKNKTGNYIVLSCFKVFFYFLIFIKFTYPVRLTPDLNLTLKTVFIDIQFFKLLSSFVFKKGIKWVEATDTCIEIFFCNFSAHIMRLQNYSLVLFADKKNLLLPAITTLLICETVH